MQPPLVISKSPFPPHELIRLQKNQKQGSDSTKYRPFMMIVSSSPPSACICLALSLRGSDTHCCSPCISSTLTLSYLDILTHFISFSISTTPHFVYLILPGNGSIAHSSLFYLPPCVTFFLCVSLSLSFSPLIGYCGLLS